MRELALHILDLCQNSLRAGATELEITIVRDSQADLLSIDIADNGRGMAASELERAADPFFTTKAAGRTGLGIPLAAQAAERADGSFRAASEPGRGTRVSATFRDSHIDRQPMGDLAATVAALLLEAPDAELRLACRSGARRYVFDTRQVRRQLGDLPLNAVAVLSVLRDTIAANTAGLFT